MKKILIIGTIAIMLSGAAIAYASNNNGTCSGTKSCSACKNCKYCGHCAKQGGSCGVCN